MIDERGTLSAESSERDRIAYLHYGHPGLYPPLIRGIKLLAERGWRVDVMGVRLDTARNSEFELPRGVQVQLSDGTHAGLRQFLHYVRWTLHCLLTIGSGHYDWIYVSDPRSAPAGLLCQWILGLKVLYHEHDAPSSKPSRFQSRLIKKCRNWLAKRAEVCLAPNESRLRLLPSPSEEGQRRLAVKNVPLRREVCRNRGNKEERIEVLYMGSIVPARFPTSVIDAVAMAPTVVLRVVGYETVGHPGYVADLKRRADRLKILSRISFCGFRRSFEALSDLIRMIDVGLSLLPQVTRDPNETTMAGASNKAFQYLACGVPLLVTDRPEWREMFVERGVARACQPESVVSVASELMWFIENREIAEEMGRRGRKLIEEEWNYETEFAPVIETLELGRRSQSLKDDSPYF